MRLFALALALLAAGAASADGGRRILVSEGVGDWFERHYDGSSLMPNQCNDTPGCYGGGAYTAPEAALDATIEELATACAQYPHIAFHVPFIAGPPGSDMVRLDLKTKGVVDGIIARGIQCAIEVQARGIDVMQLGGRPWQAGTITTDAGRRYNRSAQGCAHGTISHHHSAEAGDRECGWPRVGICAAGSRADQWCRCYGTDGQLDGDGTCVDALDTDCPSSACVVSDWDASWFRTDTDATIAAVYDDYAQIKTVGRADMWCDGISRVNESDCDGASDPSIEQLIPSGERAIPYVYREYFDFDYGSSEHSSDFTGTQTTRDVSSATSTTATVTGAGWTTNQWASGRAYIRFDDASGDNGSSISWESREVVSNTADTITVTPAWTATPSAGTPIGIVASGGSIDVRAEVSGVILDAENADLQAHQAAIPFALAYDLGIPPTHPLVVSVGTKFGFWSIAAPDGGLVNAPCRTVGNAFEGLNRFTRPTILGGEGKCPVTNSSTGSYGAPWPTIGQYEIAWNSFARLIRDQIATSYYPNARLSSVSAPQKNRFGTTLGGQGTWEGLSADVHDSTRYAGSRYNEVVPGTSFPFDAAACEDGVDNDSDTFIDYPADTGCASAADDDETNAAVACADGIDNDGDTFTDWPDDVGCSSAADTNELGTSQCDDGSDNDADTDIDFPDDAGCTDPGDNDEANTGTLVADFASTKMQGTTCVAPCVVHFDAIGDGTDLTVDTDYTREFHTLKYRWDFDDVGSGTWSTGASGGASRNAGEGAIQAHVYYTAGTYDPVLTVTAPDGDTDTATASITVVNPDTLTTYCVSTSGTYTGCTGTGITTSNFNTALSSAGATSGKVRVRFRGGETWDSSTSTTLSTAAGAGLIDSYGTGKAIIEKSSPETSSTTTLATVSGGWTIYNIRTDVGIQNASTWVLPTTTTSTSGASIIGTECMANGNYCVSTNGAATGGSPYNAAFVDNYGEAFVDPDGTNTCGGGGVCTPSTGGVCVGGTQDGTACGPLGSNDPAGGVFFRHNNMVVMGNDMTSPRYMTRTVHANKAIFAHNSYEVTVNPNNPFQLRSCDSSALSCGGDNTVQQSRWIIVADNLFESFEPTGNTIVKLCDDSRCSSTDVDLTGLGGLNDVIIERNLDRYIVGGSGQVGSNGFVGFHSGTDITIRNNVRDAQGIASTGSSLAFASFATFTEQPGVRVHVYNNTLYTDDTAASKTVDLCVSSSSYMTSGFCYGNLSYTPNVGGAKNATVGSGWTSADNVFATSSPFTATPPTQGATALSSFAIAPAGQADGTGYDFTGTDLWNMLDADGCLRAAPWDAGAWQIGAGSCLP